MSKFSQGDYVEFSTYFPPYRRYRIKDISTLEDGRSKYSLYSLEYQEDHAKDDFTTLTDSEGKVMWIEERGLVKVTPKFQKGDQVVESGPWPRICTIEDIQGPNGDGHYKLKFFNMEGWAPEGHYTKYTPGMPRRH